MKSATASAPGKFVILGEHAVVFGKPAVALAINRRITCTIRESHRFIINGEPDELVRHPHIQYLLDEHGLKGIEIISESNLLSGAGLGSSAALCASLSCAIRSMLGKSVEEEDIIKEAYAAEYHSQGVGSPMDTSASVHGGGIGLNIPDLGKIIWTVENEGRRWDVFDIHTPEMTFVIGYTGVKAHTGPLVKKVRRYRDRNGFAKDIINEIGDLTLDGAKLLREDDRCGLGELMTRNHKLLSILGVSSPELNRLVNAANEYSYGAKLTGAGGGGSMIALTDRPERVCETIRLHGGIPIIVSTGEPGVRVEPSKFQ